ncbi:MAG: holo-[acyl-carrier protein] synthase [Bermanella sp.]|jgi:holo-[acyl-carrier protein] synthase
MSIAIGTDIVEIERIAEAYSRQGHKLVKRILTPSEIKIFENISNLQSQVSYLAKRWCVKEAVAKALGTGIAKGIGWQQMEVTNNELGAPQMVLSGKAEVRMKALGGKNVLISLSDERLYAMAFCTLV